MLTGKNRLKARKDFQIILKKGKIIHGKFFFLKYLPVNLPNSLFGFIVTTRVDKKASTRNFIKRQLRHLVRLYIIPKLTKKIKAVLVANPLIVKKKNKFIEEDLLHVFYRQGLIDQSEPNK